MYVLFVFAGMWLPLSVITTLHYVAKIIFRGGTCTRFQPGIALPSITWTEPGITLKHGRGICLGFLRLSTIPHTVKQKVGICLVTIIDA